MKKEGENFMHNNNQIGTAWLGKHVVIITCNPLINSVIGMVHSVAAPVEPIQSSCTETLGMYFSIGYSLINVTALDTYTIQYVFVK
jgi:hypothetical protein